MKPSFFLRLFFELGSEVFVSVTKAFSYALKPGTSPGRRHLLPGDLFFMVVLLMPHGDLLFPLPAQQLSIRAVGRHSRIMHGGLVYRTFHSANKVTKTIDKTESAIVTTLCVTSRRQDSCVRS